MQEKVKPEDLREFMNQMLEEYGSAVIKATETAAARTSKEVRGHLRSPSTGEFKNKTGDYRKGWRISTEVKAVNVKTIVYNQTDWPLTHLLEFGHQLVRGGRLGAGGVVIGEVKAFPHLAKENAWAAEEFQKRLIEEVEKI